MKTNKSILKINESQLKQMISESVRNVLKEIDLGSLEDTRDESNYWVGLLEGEYREWLKQTEILYKVLQHRYGRGKIDYDEPNEYEQGTKLSYELKSISDKIKGFIDRKRKQSYSFENGVEDGYIKRFGASNDDMGNNLANIDDEQLDNAEWRDNNLNAQEQDYYNYRTKRYKGI